MKTKTNDEIRATGLNGLVLLVIKEAGERDAGADMTLDECRQLIKMLQSAIVEAAR